MSLFLWEPKRGSTMIPNRTRKHPIRWGPDPVPGPSRHTPVLFLSNRLMAHRRSDLWANTCSRRTLSAERSVRPALQTRRQHNVNGFSVILRNPKRRKCNEPSYVKALAVSRLTGSILLCCRWSMRPHSANVKVSLAQTPAQSKGKQTRYNVFDNGILICFQVNCVTFVHASCFQLLPYVTDKL